MATWRVYVKAQDAEKMEAFKNDPRFFKKLYSHGGAEAVFELPENNPKGADEVVSEAVKLGFEAKKERFEDPLESSGAQADFW
ncbi:MAG: hypothetical protein ACYDBQ_05640 [Thermoplasmatota archaeon]